MKIKQGPNKKLVLMLASTAMTAGTGAGNRPKVFGIAGSRSRRRYFGAAKPIRRVKKNDRRDDGKGDAVDSAIEGFTRHGEFVIEAQP